jgi:hypothetical protein
VAWISGGQWPALLHSERPLIAGLERLPGKKVLLQEENAA